MQNFIEKPTSKLKKDMRKAKETWIEEQCQGIEENLQQQHQQEQKQTNKNQQQQQKSLPTCERTDKLETRQNY